MKKLLITLFFLASASNSLAFCLGLDLLPLAYCRAEIVYPNGANAAKAAKEYMEYRRACQPVDLNDDLTKFAEL